MVEAVIQSPNRNTLRHICLSAVVMFLTACVYFPKKVTYNPSNCEEAIARLKLDSTKLDPPIQNCGTAECAALVIAGAIIIPTTTFIISGTIVIAGNAYFKIEEELICDVTPVKESIASTQSAVTL